MKIIYFILFLCLSLHHSFASVDASKHVKPHLSAKKPGEIPRLQAYTELLKVHPELAELKTAKIPKLSPALFKKAAGLKAPKATPKLFKARRLKAAQLKKPAPKATLKATELKAAQLKKPAPKATLKATELKAAQLKKPAPKATLKANGLKANKHELKKPAPKAMPKLKSMNHFLGDGSGPSTPQGLSTTDGWSVAEIVVATFGGFVALVVGAVLFQRCSKKDNPTTETNADTAKNRDDVNNESEELLPENIIF